MSQSDSGRHSCPSQIIDQAIDEARMYQQAGLTTGRMYVQGTFLDGRFLVNRTDGPSESFPLNLVLNWESELRE